MRATTLKRDARMLDDHILADAGGWIVERITPPDVDDLVDWWCEKEKPRGGKYAASSINTMIKTLKLFLAWVWRRCDMDGRHPAEDLKPLPVTSRNRARQPTVLSVDHMKALKASTREHYPQHYALVLLGLTTGQRFSELSALHWEDVDFEVGVVRFGHSQVEGRRNRGNKIGVSVTEPLLPEVREALHAHRQKMIADEHPGVSSGIVFPAKIDPDEAEHNGYMQRWTLNGVLRKACAKAVWEDEHGNEREGIPRITPHDFRHNLTTTLVELGTPRHLVQAVIGHQTDEMTEHYSHIRPEVKEAVLAPVIEAWGLQG